MDPLDMLFAPAAAPPARTATAETTAAAPAPAKPVPGWMLLVAAGLLIWWLSAPAKKGGH